MKKIILFFLIAVFAFTAVFAQNRDGKRPDAQQRATQKVERMSQEVDLNQEQKEALIASFSKHYEQKKALRGQIKGANREQYRQLRSSLDAEIKQILESEDQYKAYQDFMAKERTQYKRGGDERRYEKGQNRRHGRNG